jgi:hypothetical protein
MPGHGCFDEGRLMEIAARPLKERMFEGELLRAACKSGHVVASVQSDARRQSSRALGRADDEDSHVLFPGL